MSDISAWNTVAVGDRVRLTKGETSIAGSVGAVFGERRITVGGFDFFRTGSWTLVITDRAPRPVYANSPRMEPVGGDIVRDGLGKVYHGNPLTPGDAVVVWWRRERNEGWLWRGLGDLVQPLMLLVDGETMRAVTE